MARFRKSIPKTLQHGGIIGSSLFVIKENKVTKTFYGFADLKSKRLVDKNTIYHWASITKTFTGIAIMQLLDREKLKLNQRFT